MISQEEVQYLYWLGRDVWDGSSGVLEVGPWLGGSTWCLASGVEDNPRRRATRPLHVIDNFRWRPLMAQRAPLELPPDSSFRPHFERNVSPKRHLLAIHEVTLPDDASADLTHDDPVRGNSSGLPLLSGSDLPAEIDIAFIDGAKSWMGLIHLLREIGPRCISGRTLLVLQDFKYWADYWVPLGIAWLLRELPHALEVVHVLEQNTVTFRVEKQISVELLDRFPKDVAQISTTQGLELIDSAADLLAAQSDAVGWCIVQLGAVAFLGTRAEWNEAIRRFRWVEQKWPWFGHPIGPLDRARSWLERHTGGSFPPSTRARTATTYCKARNRMLKLRSRAPTPGGWQT